MTDDTGRGEGSEVRFDEQDGEGTYRTVYRIAEVDLDPQFQ